MSDQGNSETASPNGAVTPALEFDANACCDRLRDMWLSLGAQIADCATDAVIDGRITTAVQWGMAAEACFWQATGESDSFSIRDVLKTDDRTVASPTL